MRVYLLAAGILTGAMAGCSETPSLSAGESLAASQPSIELLSSRHSKRTSSSIASLPDRGELLQYDEGAKPAKRGNALWRPVSLSEEHALRAIVTGTLSLSTPDGASMRVRYQRHVEHQNGTWTWIGRSEGLEGGRETVLTFGEKAVFGWVPVADGQTLKLTTERGHTWLVQTTDTVKNRKHLDDADFVLPLAQSTNLAPTLGASRSTTRTIAGMRADKSHTTSGPIVDVVLGYTSGLANRLGGDSQAVTRLTHLVDLANQAYVASGVEGHLRLVHAMRVSYSDTTTNRSTLFQLTGVSCTSGSGSELPEGGVNCTPATIPDALKPLHVARDAYGGDLVSLVRDYDSSQQSCGIAWMLGGGQTEITSDDAAFAVSIVSDSAGTECRDDTLAHETGHNLGLQHDRATAQGTDDSNNDGDLLDPEEYGRYPYAFGYSAGVSEGNFYTVMALRRSGQAGYLVFSNPTISTCGGRPCGVADSADSARALRDTMPVVASFRTKGTAPAQATAVLLKQIDVNGNGKSDLFFFRHAFDRIATWFMSGNVITAAAGSTMSGDYRVVDTGDFDGDRRGDLLLTSPARDFVVGISNGTTHSYSDLALNYPSGYLVLGLTDVNGDGRSDILLRNVSTGLVTVWYMAGTTRYAFNSHGFSTAWALMATGDFNGDRKGDLLWQDGSGRLYVSLSTGTGFTSLDTGLSATATYPVLGANDINGDGRSDILLYSGSSGRLVVWYMNGATRFAYNAHVTPAGMEPMGRGDFDGNGRGDMAFQDPTTKVVALMLSSGSTFSTTAIGTTPASDAWLMDNN